MIYDIINSKGIIIDSIEAGSEDEAVNAAFDLFPEEDNINVKPKEKPKSKMLQSAEKFLGTIPVEEATLENYLKGNVNDALKKSVNTAFRVPAAALTSGVRGLATGVDKLITEGGKFFRHQPIEGSKPGPYVGNILGRTSEVLEGKDLNTVQELLSDPLLYLPEVSLPIKLAEKAGKAAPLLKDIFNVGLQTGGEVALDTDVNPFILGGSGLAGAALTKKVIRPLAKDQIYNKIATTASFSPEKLDNYLNAAERGELPKLSIFKDKSLKNIKEKLSSLNDEQSKLEDELTSLISMDINIYDIMDQLEREAYKEFKAGGSKSTYDEIVNILNTERKSLDENLKNFSSESLPEDKNTSYLQETTSVLGDDNPLVKRFSKTPPKDSRHSGKQDTPFSMAIKRRREFAEPADFGKLMSPTYGAKPPKISEDVYRDLYEGVNKQVANQVEKNKWYDVYIPKFQKQYDNAISKEAKTSIVERAKFEIKNNRFISNESKESLLRNIETVLKEKQHKTEGSAAKAKFQKAQEAFSTAIPVRNTLQRSVQRGIDRVGSGPIALPYGPAVMLYNTAPYLNRKIVPFMANTIDED